MNRFLQILILAFPLVASGAPSISYTSYFHNIVVNTNITLGGVARSTWPAGATAGTVINTGASTVGAVPAYTDLTGTNVAPSTLSATGLINIGTDAGSTAILDGSIQVLNFGNGAGFGAKMTNAYSVYNTGDFAGNGQVVRNGSGYIFNYGDSAGVNSIHTDSGVFAIYNYGTSAGSAILNNANSIYAFGSSALAGASLTNSSRVYVFGNDAGNSLSGSYTNIYLWGTSAQPTLTANQHVFGAGTDNYAFPGSGQVTAHSGVFTNGLTAGASTFTGAVNIGASNFVRGGDADSGITFGADGRTMDWMRDGAVIARIGSNLGIAGQIAIGSTGASTDVILVRDGAANTLQLGLDAASPAAQVFKGPDGVGTDKTSGGLTLDGGKPTGTGLPQRVWVKTTTTSAASSATAQTYTDPFSLGGTLKTDTTTTGNVDGGEDNLISYALTAGQLSVNGDSIEFDCAGTFAADTHLKTLKAYFGGTVLISTTSLIFNNLDWRIHGRVIRASATTQKATCEITVGGTLLSAVNSTITDYTAPGETLANSITFKCTGSDDDGVTPTSNAVVQQLMTVKFFPNGN